MRCESKMRAASMMAIMLLGGAATSIGYGQLPSAVRDEANPTSGSITAPVREIADPYTGMLWVLSRDASHPGGPGKMIATSERVADVRRGVVPRTTVTMVPVIRAGDGILVEEHTRLVDLELEAVALGPATPGKMLHARTRSGSVLCATALGPGRAELATGTATPRTFASGNGEKR